VSKTSDGNLGKAVIIDLDGTLADCRHRLHLVKEKKWDEFHAGCKFDEPNAWCVDLVMKYIMDYQVIFLTGRSDSVKDLTEKWLKKHLGIFPDSYVLHMRPHKDHRPDYVFKEEIYTEYIKDTWDVVFCLEDRDRVIKMWRRLGLVALQCAPDEVPL